MRVVHDMAKINRLSKEELKEIALTKAEMAELAKARKMPITFDEDCLETTPEKAKKFRRINPSKRVAL